MLNIKNLIKLIYKLTEKRTICKGEYCYVYVHISLPAVRRLCCCNFSPFFPRQKLCNGKAALNFIKTNA